MTNMLFEITCFEKNGGGILTKQISLGPSGKIIKDASACRMKDGLASRAPLPDLPGFGELIDGLKPNQAIALGRLRPGLPTTCRVLTKAYRARLGEVPDFVIARSEEFFGYAAGVTPVLLDFDDGGINPAVAAKIDAAGGVWPALCEVLPALTTIGRIERMSTSAGIYHVGTRQTYPESNGRHYFILIKDGTDAERFLRDFHARCWLHGFAWFKLGAAGQLLSRSLIDHLVGSPERFAFEAAPNVAPPLAQDPELRHPKFYDGEILDSMSVCPPLDGASLARLKQLQTAERARMQPAATKARREYVNMHVEEMVKGGLGRHEAARVVGLQTVGVLLPTVVLPWDDDELAGHTVRDVLLNPTVYDGCTMADPLDEPDRHGRAKLYHNDIKGPAIHSFAHGETLYQLRFDYAMVVAKLDEVAATNRDNLVDQLLWFVAVSELNETDDDKLISFVSTHAKVTKRSLRAQIKAIRSSMPPPTQIEAKFAVIDGCLAHLKRDQAGTVVSVPLANFAARIIEDLQLDDGAVVTRKFTLQGELNDGTPLPTISVPASQFDGPGWVTPGWGAQAIVHTGYGFQALGEAIKTVSDLPEQHIVYGHIGWRQINGQWVYLHGGGALGADGPVPSIAVDIEGELGHLALPVPGPHDKLLSAVSKSIDLLRLNPTIAAAAWRAPLTEFCPVDTSVYMEGRTGSLKSALQGVAQAHWGSRWDGRRFPAYWLGTANFIEKQAFIAKDCLLVIDDFAPDGTRLSVAELHKKAAQAFRSQGNLGGRGRLDRNTRTRPTYAPRGLLAASGEDIPRGHSLRSRLFIEGIGPDVIDASKLKDLQAAAKSGLLAAAMAGYVKWIAGRVNEELLAIPGLDSGSVVNQPDKRFRAELARRQDQWAAQFAGSHRRTAPAAGSLMLGVTTFLEFALELGAITADACDQLQAQAVGHLKCVATSQADELHQEDPVDVYLEAIPSLLAAGRAHLAAKNGKEPKKDQALLGWREMVRNFATSSVVEWMPHGDRIGWTDGVMIWLLPEASVGAVEKLLLEQGRSLGLGHHTLGKRLRDRKLLTDANDDSYAKTVRVADIGPVRVLQFNKTSFYPT